MHQRRELSDAKICTSGDRNTQYRSLRAAVPCLNGRRTCSLFWLRGNVQHNEGCQRAGRRNFYHWLKSNRAAPGLWKHDSPGGTQTRRETGCG